MVPSSRPKVTALLDTKRPVSDVKTKKAGYEKTLIHICFKLFHCQVFTNFKTTVNYFITCHILGLSTLRRYAKTFSIESGVLDNVLNTMQQKGY